MVEKIATPQSETKPLLNVAAYCRVSTDSDEQQVSFDTQVSSYQNKILANPEWHYAGVYTDEGISGTAMAKRPGFMQMMEDADAGKIDRILTKSISRFARNTMDCVNCVRHLKEKGITILFEKENIDTGTAFSEMLLTILAAFAQEESRSISSNTRWSIQKQFEEGHARWMPLYGYRKDVKSEMEYIIVEEEAEVVREIFNLYEKGNSMVEICEILDRKGIEPPSGKECWDTNRIRTMLANERYSGDIVLQKTYAESHLTHKTVPNNGMFPKYRVRNHHAAIITPEQFQRCEEIREMRNNKKTGHNDYPFGKKLICPICGKPMIQQKVIAPDPTRAWRCEDDPFMIYSRNVELAFLEAYRTADLQEIAGIAEKYFNAEKGSSEYDLGQSAQTFLKYRANVKNFRSIDYWWVDRIVERITFGDHKSHETATMTVHWKCGVETTVPTGVDLERRDPEKAWNADHRSWYRKKKEAVAV